MNCHQYKEELSRLAEQEQSLLEGSAELRDHLQGCLECTLLLSEQQLACFLDDPAPSPDLDRRSQQTIEMLLAEGLTQPEAPPAMPWWIRIAAAVLVMGFLGYGLWHALDAAEEQPLTAELHVVPPAPAKTSFQPVVTQMVSADSALEWQGTLDGEPAIFIDLQPEVQFAY